MGELGEMDADIVAPELFGQEIKEVEKDLEDCAKSIRFDHLSVSKEDRKRAEREAEKRREEEEARAARMKAKNARDPRKKSCIEAREYAAVRVGHDWQRCAHEASRCHGRTWNTRAGFDGRCPGAAIHGYRS